MKRVKEPQAPQPPVHEWLGASQRLSPRDGRDRRGRGKGKALRGAHVPFREQGRWDFPPPFLPEIRDGVRRERCRDFKGPKLVPHAEKGLGSGGVCGKGAATGPVLWGERKTHTARRMPSAPHDGDWEQVAVPLTFAAQRGHHASLSQPEGLDLRAWEVRGTREEAFVNGILFQHYDKQIQK